MKFLLLLPAFLLAHLSAAFFDGGSRENELLDQEWEAGKCSCTCNCEGAPEVPCDVDLYILLDAAVCVRGIWDEMKFRVNLLAKSLDEENGNLGNIESTRLSVISYAKSAITHISINENLNYYQFSEKLDKINWLNEGSYLNNGLIELERNLNQGYSRNKQVSVLLVTNGKSHKSVGDHEVGTILKRIRDQHNAHLFVNTLVPVQTELEYEDCRVCDFNRDLFIGELDMSVREMDEEFVNLDNGSVISKDDLLSAFVKEYTQMCPDIVDPRYCDDCVCSCAMPEGEDGNNGPRGLDGNDGFQGKDGDDGNDGEPGRCGIEGPDGIFGLNGRDGSPGAHGSSGTAGMTGDNGDKGADGNQGRIGRPGASGRIGKSGEKGKPGVPGPDGDIGPRGDTGEKGLKGPNGNQHACRIFWITSLSKCISPTISNYLNFLVKIDHFW